MKRADSSVSEYYAKYNTQYKSIEFNRMQLTYCLKPGAQDGEFEYVPAWMRNVRCGTEIPAPQSAYPNRDGMRSALSVRDNPA